jgi:hypothetical protein
MIRRKWVKALFVAYVLGVLFCITVTANHWLLDAVGGLAVLGLGALGAWGIDRAGAAWRARGRVPDRGGVSTPPAPSGAC